MNGVGLKAKMFANSIDNVVNTDTFGLITDNTANDMLRQVEIYLLIEDCRTCHNSDYDTFQVTNAFIDIFRNIVYNLRWKLQSVTMDFIS